jgi:hypothetical protein
MPQYPQQSKAETKPNLRQMKMKKKTPQVKIMRMRAIEENIASKVDEKSN